MTERQKKILEEVGLPTDYEKLLAGQKDSINAIEEMLSYLEEKYNRGFCYAGYIKRGILEREHLVAYAEGGNQATDCFRVYRNGEEFTDNYMTIAVRDGYEQYVKKCLLNADGVLEAVVFSDKIETEMTVLPASDAQYESDIRATNTIFVYTGATSGSCTAVVHAIREILTARNLKGEHDLIFMESKDLQQITRDIYLDFLWPADYYFHREIIRVE